MCIYIYTQYSYYERILYLQLNFKDSDDNHRYFGCCFMFYIFLKLRYGKGRPLAK